MSGVIQSLLMSSASSSSTITLLHLHFDGSDASTTFTDSSAYGHTVTANGDAQIDTAQSKFGGASGYFDGTGDYLTVADATALEPAGFDFTLQCWIRPANVSAGNYNIATKRADNTGYAPFLLRREGNTLSLKHSTNGSSWADEDTGGTLSANTWHHVALIRAGAVLKVYLDGSSAITQTVSGSLTDNANALVIGGDTNANYWIGHIDEFLYERGARWTANFTPPTGAY